MRIVIIAKNTRDEPVVLLAVFLPVGIQARSSPGSRELESEPDSARGRAVNSRAGGFLSDERAPPRCLPPSPVVCRFGQRMPDACL